MPYNKVLITGATGFIGSRLCEKFTLHYRSPYRALVRNFGKAARIARLGTEMVAGDLSSAPSLDAALQGCDAVVHLAFSDKRDAEAPLLAACRRAQVKRFVHMSSMAVHGPRPDAQCAREETATIGHYNERYSDAKARSERTVQRAVASGLPGVILRPTIVYGPYSPFVVRLVQDARRGTISLIDGGVGVCNAVYVDDVCDAVHAALYADKALGNAMFINADRAVTWRDFNLAFAKMVLPDVAVANFASTSVRAHWDAMKPSIKSNIATMKALLKSPSFHDELATVPMLKSAIMWAKANLKKVLSAEQVIALQSKVVRPGSGITWPDRGRLTREDFHLEFRNDLAKSLLDWRPAFDFAAGALLTGTWIDFIGARDIARRSDVQLTSQ